MGDERVCRQAVDHDELAGALFHPSGDGPYPAVIALHGSGGYRPEGIARRLATRGYVTLALQYFSEEDVLPEKLREIPLAYFDTAAEWLLEQPTVKGDQAGLVGISRGAEAALLLGTRFDWVGCVVSYSGSGVAWDTPHDDPAWIHDGEPVPHLTAEENPMTRMRRGVDEDRIERAAMAVEKTDGPILLLSGGEDRVWPARRLSNIAVDRLDTADFEYMFEHLTYDDVGHLLAFPSYMPLGNVAEEPTMLKAMARATADSWPTVLEYLARGLDADETQAVRTEEEFEVVEGMLGED
jgi:nucleolar protein 56